MLNNVSGNNSLSAANKVILKTDTASRDELLNRATAKPRLFFSSSKRAFFRFARSWNTRGHGYKLFTEQSTNNVRYHSFAKRVVGPWNRLPAHVDFSSLVRFNAFLNRTDLSNFLLYCVD